MQRIVRRRATHVVVIAGKEKGKKGRVLRLLTKKRPGRDRAGRHGQAAHPGRPRPSPQGGIIEKEGIVELSNVALWCDKCGAGAPGHGPRSKRVRRSSGSASNAERSSRSPEPVTDRSLKEQTHGRGEKTTARPTSREAEGRRRQASHARAEQQAEAAAKRAARAQGKGKGKGGAGRRPPARWPPRSCAGPRRPAADALRQGAASQQLMKELGLKNPMQAPRMTRSRSTWAWARRWPTPRSSTRPSRSWRSITGQQPVVTRAKKSIAVFKLREGQKIGAMVTLRRDRMWEFLDRLVTFALPRVRDFKGVSPGPSTAGATTPWASASRSSSRRSEYDKIEKIKGMNITFVTTARTDEQGRALLRHLGMPFQELAPWQRPSICFPKTAQVRVRHRNRCKQCGRVARVPPEVRAVPHLLPALALRGDIPGVIKSSW